MDEIQTLIADIEAKLSELKAKVGKGGGVQAQDGTGQAPSGDNGPPPPPPGHH